MIDKKFMLAVISGSSLILTAILVAFFVFQKHNSQLKESEDAGYELFTFLMEENAKSADEKQKFLKTFSKRNDSYGVLANFNLATISSNNLDYKKSVKIYEEITKKTNNPIIKRLATYMKASALLKDNHYVEAKKVIESAKLDKERAFSASFQLMEAILYALDNHQEKMKEILFDLKNHSTYGLESAIKSTEIVADIVLKNQKYSNTKSVND